MAIAFEPPRARPSQPSAEPIAFDHDPAGAYAQVRATTARLCSSLEIEDYGMQSMENCSPAKWHLAHTTWFFETFVLQVADPSYRPFHDTFGYLFNSYYETVGRMHPRQHRGLLTRPSVPEVYRYREFVDDRLSRLLASGTIDPQVLRVIETGLHHEQQHQELILTDLKHGFSCNPLWPQYHAAPTELPPAVSPPPLRWNEHEGGVERIGYAGDRGFAFDNERPSHRVFVEPFALASRSVTCAEFLEFMADGGYERPDLWLSQGWDTVGRHGWRAPQYWVRQEDTWRIFTLAGLRELDPHEPVCHVSYYEADAYARWTGYRLPTEFDWEVSASDHPIRGNFLESGALHPRPATTDSRQGRLLQAFGDVWEWTMSAYAPYPAYRAPAGALGEYNGKFMCSQLVLRGGSCATPAAHVRPTYRNFFYPEDRWQFSGIRLARDL